MFYLFLQRAVRRLAQSQASALGNKNSICTDQHYIAGKKIILQAVYFAELAITSSRLQFDFAEARGGSFSFGDCYNILQILNSPNPS